MVNTLKMPKRFDYSASGEFNTALGKVLGDAAAHQKTQQDQKIQLDFIQTDYVDSAGIGLLVMAHKKAMAKGVVIEIVHTKNSIKDIFLLANLQKLISIK